MGCGLGTGCGSGDSSTGGRDYNGDRGDNLLPLFIPVGDN